MGLFGFLFGKAKWKSKDARVRLEAVKSLSSIGVLTQLAMNDPDGAVRVAAAHRVDDTDGARQLLKSGDEDVQKIAKQRLAGVAFKMVAERPLAQCSDLLAQIEEQSSLAELVRSAKDPAVREAAFKKWTSQAEPSQPLLSAIAIQHESSFADRAIAFIDKRGLLKDIGKKAKKAEVRQAAAARLQELEQEAAKPSPERQRKARLAELEPLILRAKQLAVTGDVRRAALEFAHLETQWQAVVAAHAQVEADQGLADAQRRFQAARKQVEDRDQAAADAARARQQAIDARRQFLATLVDQDLSEREQLQARWHSLPAVDGPEARRLDDEFAALFAPKKAQAEPALLREMDAELTALIDEASRLAESNEWRDSADRFKVLHKRWLSLASGFPNDHLAQRGFLDAYARFKDRRRQWRDEREASARDRLTQMEKLIHEAEKMPQTVEPAEEREHFDRIKELQRAWKQIGPVRPDQSAPLKTRFAAACDRAFEPVRKLREEEDWARFGNATKAEEIIAGVEQLAATESLADVAKDLKQLQARWKAVGPLPGDRRENLWQRFRAACDVQYARCREHFAQLDAEREKNLERKKALLAEIETIANRGTIGLPGSPADLRAKQEAGEKVKALQQEWKQIGPVPREQDQELWTRYKQLCDTFFASHNAARDQEQRQNLERKAALCATVEELAANAEALTGAVAGDYQRWSNQVRQFQGDWKTIGHVPMAEKDAIWDRFRAACDRIYALLKKQYAQQDQERVDNLAKKQALIGELEASVEKPEEERAKVIQDVQRRWRAIGHVPREAEEQLLKRFRDLTSQANSAAQ